MLVVNKLGWSEYTLEKWTLKNVKHNAKCYLHFFKVEPVYYFFECINLWDVMEKHCEDNEHTQVK